jgi:hypothetical protein
MMRLAPAAKAFAFATSRPGNRNVAFTALRMMSAAAPSVKVRQRHIMTTVVIVRQRLQINNYNKNNR